MDLATTDTAARCYLCGCLRAGDAETAAACDPCRGSRRDYNPAADPVFDRALEELFLRFPGQTVFPRLALGIAAGHKWAVVASVRRLRRRGMLIQGIAHSGGYVYRPGG